MFRQTKKTDRGSPSSSATAASSNFEGNPLLNVSIIPNIRSSLRSHQLPSAWLCGAVCRSPLSQPSELLTSPKHARGRDWLPFPFFHFPLLFTPDSVPAEEVTVSRGVTGDEDNSRKRSRPRHEHQRRRRHGHGNDSDQGSRSRSRSRSPSPPRSHVRSGPDGGRDDYASDSESDGHHRSKNSRRKRHKADGGSSRKRNHRYANPSRSPSRSRSPADYGDDKDPSKGPGERKETEQEYDARLEREENERIAAEKRRRLEALKDRHQRELEKPPQNGVRFKGMQMASRLLI